MSASHSLTTSTVSSENCVLTYDHTPPDASSPKPLLLFVPGAGAQAESFYSIVPFLSTHYTIILYDRRQLSRSQPSEESGYGPWNPIQQARDVVAILKDFAQKTSLSTPPRAHIVSSSSGGLVAFQLALSYPDYVGHVVVHEAPSLSLLDGRLGDRGIDAVFKIYGIWRKSGVDAALSAFKAELFGGSPHSRAQSQLPKRERMHVKPSDWDNTFKYEFITALLYSQHLHNITHNHVSIAVAHGHTSPHDTHSSPTSSLTPSVFAQSAIAQAELLDCERFVFPGGHEGFEEEPEPWAERLTEVLKMMGRIGGRGGGGGSVAVI
jgi:pimeloyl-ACP methyl ester carboxylesterase